MQAAAIAHPTGDVYFVTPNEHCEFRVRSFFNKEPDTIEWLAEINPGEVYIDVGANVGMYAVWAAKTTGARVVAFEPESQNFALLNQNIVINKCDAIAFPMALSDEMSIAPLFLSGFIGGGSCHTYGEQVNFKGQKMRAKHIQGSVAVTLDHMVNGKVIPQPDYIKIDVDGLEPKVIRGAMATLQKAKSVLIELDSNRTTHVAVMTVMQEMGYRWDQAQIDKAQRKSGSFAGIGNVIFRR